MNLIFGELKESKKFSNIANYVGSSKIEINNESYLSICLQNALKQYPNYDDYRKIQYLDIALEKSHPEFENWIFDKVKLISTENTILAKSKGMAELISFGILKQSFPKIKPNKESKNHKSPDFEIDENLFLEVYCPQESQNEIERVEKSLREQEGIVRMEITYPLTGANPMARKFPANKIIDKVLNSKSTSDQTQRNSKNLLWLDLIQSFKTEITDTKAYKSLIHNELTYTGCFGIWHAFYGQKGSTLLPERSAITYKQFIDPYFQQKDGLFRFRKSLSGAILVTLQGLIFFENPWTTDALSISDKKNLSELPFFRPEHSLFSLDNNMQFLKDIIKNELNKIKWLFAKEQR